MEEGVSLLPAPKHLANEVRKGSSVEREREWRRGYPGVESAMNEVRRV